ncbi:DNA alkylation response protein [bacterium SCN 62-11]|nr:acyl-CoA dehydrogenase family protein [Candidatus Eremiobacteraeota bacterium]ODT64719.1 MAG: DNA alkylation response protein [bacterium SCN 62-11]
MQIFPPLNQPDDLTGYNGFASDPVLSELIEKQAPWSVGLLSEMGAKVGDADWQNQGRLANRHEPELVAFSRQGERIDEVEYHPAWHRLIEAGVNAGVHSLPWVDSRAGAHQARVGLHYLLTQIEAGVGCPLTMTFAAVPALRRQPELSAIWEPRLTSREYDFGLRPAEHKKGCLSGMAMTEKQGGSDVRANTTVAEALSDGTYRLQGHKWFCSAPMCDMFLTLAQLPEGVTCFLVPRVLPDGTRNRLHIQRLKDKLGNRSNASSEIEYHGAIAWRVGEAGRGVPTIIEMVNHTRLDCVVGTTSLMRAALVQALHHCRQRSAFGKKLADQPLMRNVLADLVLDWEAALQLMMRLAAGYGAEEEQEAHFVRLATAVSKFWVCKRGARFGEETMECLGGGGYVEESVMPRIFREMPLASIWEGSGNVICLDVLRAVQKTPHTLDLFFLELEKSRGGDRRLDLWVDNLKASWFRADDAEVRARRLVERMALALQASLLLRNSPSFMAEAFCTSRLGESRGSEFGTLPAGTPLEAMVERGWQAGVREPLAAQAH